MAITFKLLPFVFLLGIKIGTLPALPVITPQESEYIIKAREDLKLTCKSNVSVLWSYPEETGITRIEIDNIAVKSYREGDIYVAELSITNASGLNARSYFCNETGKPENAASMRLYVDDDEVLCAYKWLFVSAEWFQPVVIPCKPAHPSVVVKLHGVFFAAGNHLFLDLPADNLEWPYNPRIGFHSTNVTRYLALHYVCLFMKNGTRDYRLGVDIDLREESEHPINNPTTTYCDQRCEQVTWNFNITSARIPGDVKWFDSHGKQLQNDEKFTIKNSIWTSVLIIKNATIKHRGYFTVEVGYNSGNANFSFFFLDVTDKPRITIEKDLFQMVNTTETVKCIVSGFPKPEIRWEFKRCIDDSCEYEPLTSSEKIDEPVYTSSATVNSNQSGYIKCIANNTYGTDEQISDYTVTDVKEGLKVLIKNGGIEYSVNDLQTQYLTAGSQVQFECFATIQNYSSDIKWYFNYELMDEAKVYLKDVTLETNKTQFSVKRSVVIYNVSDDHNGIYECKTGRAPIGDMQSSQINVEVVDDRDGFRVQITEDEAEFPFQNPKQIQLATGSKAEFNCIAAIQNYSSDIKWYFNDELMVGTEDLTLGSSKTQFLVTRFFIIPQMGHDHAGVYKCETARLPKGEMQFSEVTVEVVAPRKPRITATNMDRPHVKIYPNVDNLTCFYEGVPRPSVKWYKDGSAFFPDRIRVKFKIKNQVLLFSKTNYTTDEGEYTCRVENRLGFVNKTATLTFANKPTDNKTSIYITVGIFLVLLITITIPLVYKSGKERQMKKILKEAGLENFEAGAVECINPNLSIDDQAQLLPYNKKLWEISKEKMKLGKQLGAGAFGVVMEAVIERYDNNTDLKVAVKMMKKNADDIYLMALLSELKIMVHLGKHLNVVNLIGACTKHVVQRELYVIVEFCRFGNLRNYLLHHRENFINQIDPGTETIDYSIGADILSRPFPVASDDSQAGPPNGIDDDKTNSIYVTETIVPKSPDRSRGKNATMSNISIPLRARSNCKRNYKGNVKPLCTKDLLIWAFQVSRGMEYLASRRVLHGDLASRNILLADNNIVKICDFGLARRMYKNHNYKKKGRGPLPIKWMSIESMRDKVFSTQSDVWSFGIVLWEFFSLARTPYPGMEANERILQKLVEGYRMDQPTFATKEIYSLMSNCWETEPLRRPTFQKLSDRIGSMLEESITKFYIDLNDPYLAMNKERIQSGQYDYLQMVSPPDFRTLSSFNHPRRTLNTAQYDCKPKQHPPLFTSSEP